MTARPLAALLARILLAYVLVAQGVLGGAATGLTSGRSLAWQDAGLGLCHGGEEPRQHGEAGHLPTCCLAGCLPHALLPGALDPAPLARRPYPAAFTGPVPEALPPRIPSPFDATGPPRAA